MTNDFTSITLTTVTLTTGQQIAMVTKLTKAINDAVNDCARIECSDFVAPELIFQALSFSRWQLLHFMIETGIVDAKYAHAMIGASAECEAEGIDRAEAARAAPTN